MRSINGNKTDHKTDKSDSDSGDENVKKRPLRKEELKGQGVHVNFSKKTSTNEKKKQSVESACFYLFA